jgi:hypothetical protein
VQPGSGVIAGALNPRDVAQGADRLFHALADRFRSRDDARLVVEPVCTLTPVFLAGLAEAAQREHWAALFFDSWERTGPVLDVWLRDLIIEGAYGDLPSNVVVVPSGQDRLDGSCWGNCLDQVTETVLEVFGENAARDLLASRNVTDEEVVRLVLRLSGRLAVWVSTPAQIPAVLHPGGLGSGGRGPGPLSPLRAGHRRADRGAAHPRQAGHPAGSRPGPADRVRGAPERRAAPRRGLNRPSSRAIPGTPGPVPACAAH